MMIEDFKKDINNSSKEVQENRGKQVESLKEEAQKFLKALQKTTTKLVKDTKKKLNTTLKITHNSKLRNTIISMSYGNKCEPSLNQNSESKKCEFPFCEVTGFKINGNKGRHTASHSDLSTQQAWAERSPVQGQPGVHGEILS